MKISDVANATPEPAPTDTNPQADPFHILGRIHQHAQTRALETALVFPIDGGINGDTLTWSQLEELVSRFGRYLMARDVVDGDRVVLLTASVREQVLSFLGAMAAGCVPTIISYPSTKQSESSFVAMLPPVLEYVNPRFIIASQTFVPLASGCCRGDQLLTYPEDAELPAAGKLQLRSLDQQHFLQFSSGTTGIRKAVAVSGRMLLNQVTKYGRALDVRADDCVVSWLPLYHDMGLVASFLNSVWQGITSVHASPFEWLLRPECLFELIDIYRGTLVWLPNFAYDLCTDRVRVSTLSGRLRLDSLRAIINCGEPIRQRSHARFLHTFSALGVRAEHLQTCYAMAETTFAVTQSVPGTKAHVDYVDKERFADKHQAVKAMSESALTLAVVSSGRTIDGTEVRISGARAERQVGEIEVLSSSRFEGYLFGGEDAHPFTADGWYRTGDLGYLADGELYVTGRTKDLIIHRGQNIYPNDLEEALFEVPGCKPGRVVVFGVENEDTATEDIVVMIERLGHEHDPNLLTQRVREQLLARSNHIASDIVVCEPSTLHKSTSGKLSRRRNRELYIAEYRRSNSSNHASGPARSGDDLERTLTEIWKRALGLGEVSPQARLFAELGADSLSAMRAIGDIARHFRIQVSPTDLLWEDTIARQAAWLRRQDRIADPTHPIANSVLVRLQEGDGPPLFLVHPANGRAMPYTSLLSHLPHRSVYAFQAPELFSLRSHLNVPEMTAEYLQHLTRLQPSGPYLLGGWSFGGLLAYDLACQLESAGRPVARLLLFDTDPPLSRVRRFAKRVRHVVAYGCITRGIAPREGIVRHPSSMTAKFLGVLPPNLQWPEELAAVMRYVSPTHFRRLDGRGRTLAELGERLFSLLQEESDPEEMRGFFLPGLDAQDLLSGARLLVKNRYLSWAHAPRASYRGRVTIFAAANPARLQRWKAHCVGDVEIRSYPVQGGRVLPPHFTMFDAGNVALFGQDVAAALEETYPAHTTG